MRPPIVQMLTYRLRTNQRRMRESYAIAPYGLKMHFFSLSNLDCIGIGILRHDTYSRLSRWAASLTNRIIPNVVLQIELAKLPRLPSHVGQLRGNNTTLSLASQT